LPARSNNFQNPSIRWEKGILPQILQQQMQMGCNQEAAALLQNRQPSVFRWLSI